MKAPRRMILSGSVGGLALCAGLRPHRAGASSQPFPVVPPMSVLESYYCIGIRKPLPRGTPVIEWAHDYNKRVRAAVVVWSGVPSPEDSAPWNPMFPLLIRLGPDEGGRVVEASSTALRVLGFRARFFNVLPPRWPA